MRPGYLSNYRENPKRLGNFGDLDIPAKYAASYLNPYDKGLPPEAEVGYIPEYMRYSKVFPNFPFIGHNRSPRLRDPQTFNVLLI